MRNVHRLFLMGPDHQLLLTTGLGSENIEKIEFPSKPVLSRESNPMPLAFWPLDHRANHNEKTVERSSRTNRRPTWLAVHDRSRDQSKRIMCGDHCFYLNRLVGLQMQGNISCPKLHLHFDLISAFCNYLRVWHYYPGKSFLSSSLTKISLYIYSPMVVMELKKPKPE